MNIELPTKFTNDIHFFLFHMCDKIGHLILLSHENTIMITALIKESIQRNNVKVLRKLFEQKTNKQTNKNKNKKSTNATFAHTRKLCHLG